jgi:hypothetical protein
MMQNLPIDDLVKAEVKKKHQGKKKFTFVHEDPNFKTMLDEVSRNFGFKENYTSMHMRRFRQSTMAKGR